MQVIPVIDLKGGEVVRARMGDRASYRPIESPLSPTSDAVDVVRGLLAVYPFPTLYVADLDAIQRNGDNLPALRRIRAEFPALRMWIDNGAADPAALEALIGADLGEPVIGSESQRDSALVARHRDSRRIVLSLDFRGDAFQGPAEILAEPEPLAAPGHRHDPRARRQRRRPRSRRGSPRSDRSLEGAKSMPPAACATPPISPRSKRRAPPAP